MGNIMSASSLSSTPPSSWHLNNYSEFYPPYYCVNIKPIYIQIFLASWICLILSAAVYYRLKKFRNQKIVPRIEVSRTGQVLKFEKFSHYIARQMGFADRRECPNLCKLATEYIIKSEGCEEDMYNYFSIEPDADSLFIKLVEEFERCILSYFAFHWSHVPYMMSQVLSAEHFEPKKKLQKIVMAATREQRFERVTKNLKVARVLTTLVEEMKAIGLVSSDDSQCTDVMVPMAHKDRSPVLLFMGGGMGAGKSTVLKDILKEPFWIGAAANVVVIEADAFKESDVIYKALSSMGHHDMLQTAELVHQSSTDAASSLLVTALNEGRDVIMDGTLSWIPFVVQTITMDRNVHRRRYRMGVGYKKEEDGRVTENYWEQIDEEEQETDGTRKRRPYRIGLVGVVCDADLAVTRGIRRAIMCRRAVRVNSQLKSHKRFANAFNTYCQLVDNARLFSTNTLEGPPKLIGWKDRDKTLLVDPDEINVLKMVGRLNDGADSIYELYKNPHPAYQSGSVWKDIVMSPSRLNIQKELKYSIQKVESMRS
ncbi:calmodulin calcium-dependent NAD kinase-like isoform X1 [Capsicum galapagoense]